MKHFRDLVLSTREPSLHNVLWIEPKKDEQTGRYIWGEYLVKMFEDGWKILFGGGGSSSNGLGFEVLEPRTGLTQLYDVRDPDNPQKIYPITKAANVYLSNTISVETAINNINQQLRNVTSNVRKAIFAMDDMIDGWEVSKAGKTFWVYSNSSDLERDGYFTGELFLRKYTSNSSYTKETLNLGDIVMAVDDEVSSMRNTRMWYVDYISSSNLTMFSIVDRKDLIQLKNQLNLQFIKDVTIDGISITSTVGGIRKATISDDVRPVYMVNYNNLETYYPGNNKKDKVFFIKSGENESGDLLRYTSSSQYETITLQKGDILFNLDTHQDYVENALYVIVKEGTYSHIAKLIPDYEYVADMIYQYLSEALDDAKNVYIDFTASNPQTTNIGVKIWDMTTTTTVSEIVSYYTAGRNVYARLSGIANAGYQMIPEILPLLRCSDGFLLFGAFGYNKGYELDGHGTSSTEWVLREIPLQTKLTFDTTPTANSLNPVTSNGIYEALEDKTDSSDLNSYVLKSVYNERMAITPKFHRVEFLDSSEEYEPGTNYITDNTTHYLDDQGNPSASGCFNSLWWAVYDCNRDSTTTVPKLILNKGCVACYCWSDNLESESSYRTASRITLKFFNGIDVIMYDIVRVLNDPTYGTYLQVDKSTQSVTFES